MQLHPIKHDFSVVSLVLGGKRSEENDVSYDVRKIVVRFLKSRDRNLQLEMFSCLTAHGIGHGIIL